MLINILFALVALAAMCIDIVLNRGMLEEISDEANEQKKELGLLLYRKGVPRKIIERLKSVVDTVDSLTEKLKVQVQKGCASSNARPFYIVIIIASASIILSALLDCAHDMIDGYKWVDISNTVYSFLCFAGNLIWLCLFYYLIRKLYKIYKFNLQIEQERNKIRKIIQDAKYSLSFLL